MDGSVKAWGSIYNGGCNSGNGLEVSYSCKPSDLTSGVETIFSTTLAFAALKMDGSVKAWGSTSAWSLSGTDPGLTSGVVMIFSNLLAFAALTTDGSVKEWGHRGRPDPNVTSGVVTIYSTMFAFAAFLFDSTALFLLLLTAWSGTFFDHRLCGVHHGWCFVFMLVIVAANAAFFVYCIYSLRSYVLLPFGILCRKARGKKKKPAKMSMFELTEVAHINPVYLDDPEAPHSAPQVRRKCPSVRATLGSFRETAEEKAVRVSIARSTRNERDLLARRHSKMFIAAAIKDAKTREDSDSLNAKFPWWQ